MDWELFKKSLHDPEVLAVVIGAVLGAIAAFFKWILPKIVKYWYKNAVPHPVNSFPPLTKYPLSRKTMLERIFNKLSETSPVVLTGLGGIGKTQIALLYAKKYAGKYACKWWVNASSEQSIWEAYRDFAVWNLGMSHGPASEEYLEPVKRWMREHEQWLFIFNNADDLKDKQKWIPTELQGMRHVLFTSRERNWDGVADVLPVELFSLEEAREYFIKAAKRKDDGSLDALITTLGCLPLAMAQAAAYIRKEGEKHPEKGYKEYLKLFEKHTAEMLNEYPTAEADNRSVYVTWDISMKKIKKSMTSAWQLLNTIAFFAPDGIQHEWFVQGQEALPEPLQKEIGDEFRWGKIRDALTEYSLVHVGKGDVMGMHRLVGEVVRDKLKATGEFEAYAGYAVGIGKKLYLDFDEFSTRESREEFEKLYPHIESIVEHCALQDQDAQMARLYSFLGKGASDVWSNYDRALEWHEKARAIREKVLGKEDPETAETYNNIASVYYKKGEYDRALEWYEKALAIKENAFGKEHPSTATTYNDIAIIYTRKGDAGHALELYGKALAIQERVFGKEHPNTAETYSGIGIIYGGIGEYDRALEYYERALAIHEKAFGKEHSSTAETYNNIAIVYDKKGKYDRALELYEKALAIHEKIFGKEHPSMATTYSNIAITYGNKGEYDRALEWQEKALIIYERVQGKEHLDMANTYYNSAIIYYKKGEHSRAFGWFEKMLAIREKVWGKEHLGTVTTCYNIAGIYADKGEYNRALELYERVLCVWEKIFGEKHPLTISVRDNIAECKRRLQKSRITYIPLQT